MTIFEALRADHDTQRTLGKILIKTSGDSEGRSELFEKLKNALEAHAIAEERHFYVPLIKDDLTQEHARHSVAEHKELDDYVDELDKMDMSSPGWLPLAKKLHDRLVHHLDEEEKQVFPLAGKVLSDLQKTELAADYRSTMNDKS